MCVAVTMEPGTVLTEEEVVRMGRANGDGVGVSWAENGVVEWYKAIAYNPEFILKLINERVSMFRMVHFRLSTAGGVRSDLCHPFEVGPMANCDSHGHAFKVLMHNGHWHRWSDVFDILKGEGLLPDVGPWSDTRLAALMASYDIDWVDTVGGKVATMDGDGNIAFWGTWEELRPGIKVSNKTWDHNFNYKRSGKDRQWQGWGWTEENWKEHEAHQASERAKRLKEEKEENDKKGFKGGQGQKAGEIRVAMEQGDRHVRTVQTEEGGKDGGYSGSRNGQGGSSSFAPTHYTYFRDDGKFDLTPWQSTATQKWWKVDPNSVKGGNCRVVEITEAEARRLMEQTPASPAGGKI